MGSGRSETVRYLHSNPRGFDDNPERLAASVAEHRVIADAIAAGDPELAAHATHLHLHHALTSVLTALSADPAPVKGTP